MKEIASMILLATFSAFIFYGMKRAEQRGKQELKHFPQLDAIEEAVGRAAELGRPAHFTIGYDTLMSYNIPGFSMLPHIVRLCNKAGVHLIVTTPQPTVLAIYDDILHQGYQADGRPESEIDLRFLAGSTGAYTIAVQGMMLREKPAANFLMGLSKVETLIHAETGQRVGALQVGGAMGAGNLPFMACVCDYTLVGEEFLAAGALVSNDLPRLGSVTGQDWIKAVVVALVILGGIAAQFGSKYLATILKV
jgi:hypothetical protein